jgi:hypothetical protein
LPHTQQLKLVMQSNSSPGKLLQRFVTSLNGTQLQLATVLTFPGLTEPLPIMLLVHLLLMEALEHGTSSLRRMLMSPKTSKSKKTTRLTGSSKRSQKSGMQTPRPFFQQLLTHINMVLSPLLVLLRPFLELLQSSLASLPQCSEQLS